MKTSSPLEGISQAAKLDSAASEFNSRQRSSIDLLLFLNREAIWLELVLAIAFAAAWKEDIRRRFMGAEGREVLVLGNIWKRIHPTTAHPGVEDAGARELVAGPWRTEAPPGGVPPRTGTPVVRLNPHEFVEVMFQNTENELQSWHLDGYDFWIVGNPISALLLTLPPRCLLHISAEESPIASRSGSHGRGELPPPRPLVARQVLHPRRPRRHIAVPVPISAASTSNNPASDSEESPISALPDELLLECLARVPRASLPPLPVVCRRFAALIASHGFLHLRRAHGRIRPCLLAVSVSSAHSAAVTFARALLQLGASSRPELKVAALPLPPPLLHCAGSSAFAHARAVALGREVFLIGRGATFPRKKFAAAAVGGRIYVAGGTARTAAVEEYDPAADAWRVVAEAPRRRYGCAGAAAGGVFYVAGGVAVSGHPGGDGAPRALEAHACAGSVDALHVASGAWAWSARSRAVPGGGCVVGACGAEDGHLYVVATRREELKKTNRFSV
ncbi:F-box/kelch-repeat protein [Panicum miliaceum]|uniref:F-box/kelch-repeat protein n=1 Tax=Panicum miliaceum TaxID=4540 RepID=A0A3L6T2H0_PANMI|nr:F-box/kelch-repeat protein [Panicum miliaceum]